MNDKKFIKKINFQMKNQGLRQILCINENKELQNPFLIKRMI
jgi:hypothetical protein